MPDDSSIIAPAGGGSFWRKLSAFLFGDDGETTLRDQIEEVIESREGEPPAVGDLSHVERQMLKNLLHFGERTADDLAVPRGEIVAVPSSISFDALVTAFAEAGHSRLPVYEGSLDTVIGMIHMKDVFALLVSGGEPPGDLTAILRTPLYVPESMGVLDLLARMRAERVHLAIVVDEFGGTEGLLTIEDVVEEIVGDIAQLMRTPLYVPESMGVLDLLARMRAERVHLAIVVDEFGGTEGLLTIEDVVEEIVGEIEDEHDEEVPGLLIPIEDGLWEADARAELEEVALAIDARLGVVEEDVDTLGGLAFLLAGHVPQAGEILQHQSGWRLEVMEADSRRVSRLRLHAPEEGAAAG